MKTKHIFLFLMLVAALFTSCSNEMEEVQQGGKALLKIETEIEGSRAWIDATSFFEKDSIYLRFGGQSVEAVWNGYTWQHKDIELTEKPFDIFAIYYRYNFDLCSWWMDFRHGSMSESWNVPLYNGENRDIMVAKANNVSSSNSTAKLRFQHIMARIRLEIDNGIEMSLDSIKISGIRSYANYNGYTGEITSAKDYAEGESFEFYYQHPYGYDYATKQTVDIMLIPTEEEREVTITFRYYNYIEVEEYKAVVKLPALSQGSYHVIPVNIKPSVENMGIENGHTYVDLGLPSGTMWSTKNLGSYAPTGSGGHYAWGETELKETYTEQNYKFYGGRSSTYTKYNTTDNKQLLDLEDDAARVNWGGKWRMPTQEEWQELIDNCTWKWYYWGYETCGYKVTSKINGKFIYLPAAGIGTNYKYMINYRGTYGYYWASTGSSQPRRLWLSEKNYECSDMDYRHNGFSVRPVY